MYTNPRRLAECGFSQRGGPSKVPGVQLDVRSFTCRESIPINGAIVLPLIWKWLNGCGCQVILARRACTLALSLVDRWGKDKVGVEPMPVVVSSLLMNAAQFSFRVYQCAGDLNKETKELFLNDHLGFEAFEYCIFHYLGINKETDRKDVQNNKWFRIVKEHIQKENIRKEAAGEPLIEVDGMNFVTEPDKITELCTNKLKDMFSIAKNAASMPSGFAIGVGVLFEPDDSNPPARYCNVCQKAAALICGRCETVYFCSAACQVNFDNGTQPCISCLFGL